MSQVNPPFPNPDTASAQTDICVVDDEAEIAAVVCDVLEDADLHARACPLGWEAHHCIRTNQPKAVVLDVQMPELDGISLFYLMRADPATRHIPVVFLTANAHRVSGEIPNYRELNADLLEKPFDLDTLLGAVEHALSP